MVAKAKSPGPAAQRAFRIGVRAAAVAALAVVGVLYWTGAIAGYVTGFLVIVLFPVYLLVVASALSKWLGYDKDPRDLEPVTREEREDLRSDRGPWK